MGARWPERVQARMVHPKAVARRATSRPMWPYCAEPAQEGVLALCCLGALTRLVGRAERGSGERERQATYA